MVCKGILFRLKPSSRWSIIMPCTWTGWRELRGECHLSRLAISPTCEKLQLRVQSVPGQGNKTWRTKTERINKQNKKNKREAVVLPTHHNMYYLQKCIIRNAKSDTREHDNCEISCYKKFDSTFNCALNGLLHRAAAYCNSTFCKVLRSLITISWEAGASEEKLFVSATVS